MSVSVLADSAASLPAEVAGAHRVTVVPMLLTLDGTTYRDGEIPLDRVLELAKPGFSTSAPTPGQYVEAIESLGGGNGVDGVVILTVAETMSSAFESARLAAKQVDVPVEIVDTGTAAGGEALVTLAAAETAEAGADLAGVVAAARRAAANVRLVATLDSLEQLARSGRVPGAAAWAGRWLHLNPVFEFVNGHPRPLRPARSRAGALDRILAQWRGTRAGGGRLHVAALHALDPDPAEELLQRVRDEAGDSIATAMVAPFSAVMVAHTGHLVGLSWWWER